MRNASGSHRLSCVCGANIVVDPRSQNRAVVCPQCGMTVDFVVTIDPRVKNAKVSIVLPREAFGSPEQETLARTDPPARKPAPRGRPSEPVRNPKPEPIVAQLTAPCSCGATLLVDSEELTTVQTCSLCGASFHMVVKGVPGSTRKEVILVPKEPFAGRKKTIARALPSSLSPKARITVSKGPRTKIGVPAKTVKAAAPVARKPKPPAEPPPGSQAVRCRCGETLFVYRRDVGKDIPCARCGILLHLTETRDPQTLAPRVQATPVDRS